MAAARKCDRCGKYYDLNREKSINGCYVKGIRIETSATPYKYLDLCDDCINKLYDFLELNDKKN